MPHPLFSRRAFGALSALTAASLLAPGALRAQTGGAALGSVTIAVGGGQRVLYHLPLALADQLGFFRAEGLDVRVLDFPAGSLALQAVQEGEADVGSGAFEHTLRAQVQGHAYRSLVLMGRAPQLALASRCGPCLRTRVSGIWRGAALACRRWGRPPIWLPAWCWHRRVCRPATLRLSVWGRVPRR